MGGASDDSEDYDRVVKAALALAQMANHSGNHVGIRIVHTQPLSRIPSFCRP